MTKLLPDVFKMNHLQESEDAVMIPDKRIRLEGEEYEEDEAADPLESMRDYAEIQAEIQQRADTRTQQELERIQDQAYQDAYDKAYRDAFNQKKGEILTCIDGVGRVLDSLEESHKQFLQEYAEQLTDLSISVAEKVMLLKIEEDDSVLQPLVMQAVSTVKNTDWFSVELSNELSDLVFWLQNELEKPEYNRAEVSPGPYPPGTVRINTQGGTVDASVPEQIKNLRNMLPEYD